VNKNDILCLNSFKYTHSFGENLFTKGLSDDLKNTQNSAQKTLGFI